MPERLFKLVLHAVPVVTVGILHGIHEISLHTVKVRRSAVDDNSCMCRVEVKAFIEKYKYEPVDGVEGLKVVT